jgi:peptidoglycan hydrolase-like protein with peptidoglycan-binding domain
MRKPLSRATLTGLVLTAVAAGTMFVPSASARNTGTDKKASKSTKSAATSKSKAASTSSSHTTTSTAKSATKPTSSKSGKSSGRKSGKTKKVKGQAAPTPERINEIQDALARHGDLAGSSTGKFDDSTSDALRKFQAANHLNPTGKIDALTLQKLGLGSETAGLAAPTPPPNSVANRLLSRNQRNDPNDDN